MRGTGVIPPGRAGLLVVAAVIAGVVLQKSKPLMRKFGEQIEDLGRKLKDSADQPEAGEKSTTVSEAVSEPAEEVAETVEAVVVEEAEPVVEIAPEDEIPVAEIVDEATEASEDAPNA